MSELNVVVSNDKVQVVGGSLHGETIDIEFVENVVHVIDDERYVCKTIYGERVMLFVNDFVCDYMLLTGSYINFA